MSADKVRKLYNGMLPCYLYQYFKSDLRRDSERAELRSKNKKRK